MKKKGLLLLLMGLFLSSARAQTVPELARNHPILKFSFLPMFHIDNAFVVGAEIPLGNGRFSLQPEFGYGPPQSNVWYEWWFDNTYPDKTNYRTKLQFRAYFKDGGVFRGYYGGEYSYMQSDFNQHLEIFNGGTRPELKPLELRRTSHAMYAIMGWQGYFSNRLTIDFHFGFGLKATENRSLTQGLTTEQLEDIRLDEKAWFGRSRRIGQYGPYPSLMTGVQLGFILGKIN